MQNLFEIIVRIIDIHVVDVTLVGDYGGVGNIIGTTNTRDRHDTRRGVSLHDQTYILNEVGRTIRFHIRESTSGYITDIDSFTSLEIICINPIDSSKRHNKTFLVECKRLVRHTEG